MPSLWPGLTPVAGTALTLDEGGSRLLGRGSGGNLLTNSPSATARITPAESALAEHGHVIVLAHFKNRAIFLRFC